MVDHDFEYILSDTLQDVERQCLLGLHEIYHNNSYKPTSLDQENFIERMKMTVRLDREDEAFDIIYNFIQNLSSFSVLLIIILVYHLVLNMKKIGFSMKLN